jgi:hypothetical protein
MISILYRYYVSPPIDQYLKFKNHCSLVNIVYKNLKSDNSRDDRQKPQRNGTFNNLASVHGQCVHAQHCFV